MLDLAEMPRGGKREVATVREETDMPRTFESLEPRSRDRVSQRLSRAGGATTSRKPATTSVGASIRQRRSATS